jgi:ferredoxin-NADP reductase
VKKQAIKQESKVTTYPEGDKETEMDLHKEEQCPHQNKVTICGDSSFSSAIQGQIHSGADK